MAGIQETGAMMVGPLVDMWNSLVYALPGIIAAILILVLGYLVGALIGQLVKKLLQKTKVISLVVKKIGLAQEIGKWDLEGFFGLIVKWYIFIVFLNPAAQVVRLETLAVFFSQVALWVPNIILAIVIALAGYVLAEYIAKKIRETKAKKNSLMAQAAKVITLVFVVLIALKQIGIEVSVAENSFLIILSGVMLGVAIAFGLGFKDEAKSVVKDLRKRL
jgi:hypothetical protein